MASRRCIRSRFWATISTLSGARKNAPNCPTSVVERSLLLRKSSGASLRTRHDRPTFRHGKVPSLHQRQTVASPTPTSPANSSTLSNSVSGRGAMFVPHLPACITYLDLLKERGYSGKDRTVRRYVRNLRKMMAELPPEEQARFSEAGSFKVPSARRAARWLARLTEDLNDEQRTFVEQLCQSSPEAKKAREVSLKFRKMITKRQVERFDGWLEAASQSGMRELKSFVRTLSWDHEAVAAALEHERSQGQVEGQINRPKLIKRSMYGRANFYLLRARVLHAACEY